MGSRHPLNWAIALILIPGACTAKLDAIAAAPKQETSAPKPTPLSTPLGWRAFNALPIATFSAVDPRDHDVTAICAAAGRIGFYYDLPVSAPRTGHLVLTSGNVSVAVPPREVSERRMSPPPVVKPNDGPGFLIGIQASADLPIDLPPIARFLETGELQVEWGPHRLRLDARPEDLPALNSALRRCS